MTRTAISPRLATRTFANISGAACYPPASSSSATASRHGTPRSALQGQADPPLSDAGRARGGGAARPCSARFPSRSERSSQRPRARARDRRAARLSRRARRPALARDRRRRVGGPAAGAELPAGTEPAWRGGPLMPPGGESWERPQPRVGRRAGRAARRRRDVAGGLPRRRRSAPRSRCSPAPTRARIAGPANASVTVLRPGPSPQLETYGWTPNGALFGP